MKAIKLLVGACVVYVLIAACSALDMPPNEPLVGGSATISSRSAATSGAGPGGGITDPVPSAHADHTDGRRLRAIFIDGDDGSSFPLGQAWYDVDLAAYCIYWDGRCAPVNRIAPLGLGIDSLPSSHVASISFSFSDPGCTVPLAHIDDAYGPARIAMAPTVYPSSPPTYKVYWVGSEHTQAVFFSAGGSACESRPPGAARYYALGEELSASAFVGMKVRLP